jgi:hypothetical protein
VICTASPGSDLRYPVGVKHVRICDGAGWPPEERYVREDQILPHLAAVAILLGHEPAPSSGITQITAPDETTALIDQLRTAGIILIYDPDTRTLRTQRQEHRGSRCRPGLLASG